MNRFGRSGGVYDWLWFLSWGVASSLWCWTAARELGPTFDEPVYISRGLEGWRTGSHRGLLQMGTMPLPVDVDTLPLFLWERWHGIRLDPAGDLGQLLPWARAGTLIFWWLLLAYARLGGRQLAGPWGGRLAVCLLACEPILLAHASLATTDIAVSACLLALVYHFRTGRDASWGRRIGLPAVWFAAAVLAKASGLVFGPICLLVVELEYLLSKSKGQSPEAKVQGLMSEAENQKGSGFRLWVLDFGLWTLRPFRRDVLQIVAGGLLLAFVYCGSDWNAEPSFVEWAHRLPDGACSRALVWLAEQLRVFSNAGEGLVRQVKHNVRGHGTYLLGEVANRALWYYFPLALTIKLSVPLLILPVVLAAARPRTLVNWACLSALALLAFSATYRVQIGIRLVLPLVALTVVGLAAAAVQASRALSGRGGEGESERVREWESERVREWESGTMGRWLRARALTLSLSYSLTLLIAASVVWTASAALWVWPHGLCYTNAFWGGTEQGYLWLSDSNYDWGQGLKELARWQQRHGDGPLDVWYFGSDPSLPSLPMREIHFHTLSIKGPEDFMAQVRGHYLAVSTTLLYGSVTASLRSSDSAAEAYEQVVAVLHGRRPVDRTATFLIYDFTGRCDGGAKIPAERQPLTAAP